MKTIALTLMLLFHGVLSAQNIIKVFTTDQIKDLNPFMCRSQIEFTLQQVVFPPLMDNFRIKEEQRSEFQELIVSQGAIQRGRDNREVTILTRGRGFPVSFYSLQKNFEAVRMLKGQSPFSWNCGTVFRDRRGNIKIEFEKGGKARYQGCSIPMVKFDGEGVDWKEPGSTSIQFDKPFQAGASKESLIGYPLYPDSHHYSYTDIQFNNQMVTVKTKKPGSPVIQAIVRPNYQSFIQILNSNINSEWKVGINISPLTLKLDQNMKFYDQGFTHNYVKLMRFTKRGLMHKGESSGIRIDHIRYIRYSYYNKYRSHNLFGKIHSVVRSSGFTRIPVRSAIKPDMSKLKKRRFTLQYVMDDLTEEMANMMQEIFREMGLELVTQQANSIDMKADAVIETVYLFEPEYLNVSYYEKWNDYYSSDPDDRGSSIWGGVVVIRNITDTLDRENMDTQEKEMLDALPVVFLYQFASRIGYKNFTPKRKRVIKEKTANGEETKEEIKGTPFFFFNVIEWGR